MSKSRRHQNGRHPHAHFPEKRHAQEQFRIRQTGTRRNVSHCRKILKAKKKKKIVNQLHIPTRGTDFDDHITAFHSIIKNLIHNTEFR